MKRPASLDFKPSHPRTLHQIVGAGSRSIFMQFVLLALPIKDHNFIAPQLESPSCKHQCLSSQGGEMNKLTRHAAIVPAASLLCRAMDTGARRRNKGQTTGDRPDCSRHGATPVMRPGCPAADRCRICAELLLESASTMQALSAGSHGQRRYSVHLFYLASMM